MGKTFTIPKGMSIADTEIMLVGREQKLLVKEADGDANRVKRVVMDKYREYGLFDVDRSIVLTLDGIPRAAIVTQAKRVYVKRFEASESELIEGVWQLKAQHP